MNSKLGSTCKNYKIVALYKFVDLPEYETLREQIFSKLQNHNILGTILLSSEGINGTITGTEQDINAVIDFILSYKELNDIEFKESYANKLPFHRLKVKIKPEIVTTGDLSIKPHIKTGKHVDHDQWNELLAADDVMVLDTRNKYEIELGTFEGAEHLGLDDFRNFKHKVDEIDPNKNSKIAMFCTGGIRCEKAAAIMLEKGFKEVYQLQGGILKYLEKVEQADSKWQGECFVFDNRVTVDSNLEPGSFEFCHACRHPLNDTDRSSKVFKPHVCCPHCYESSDFKKQRAAQRQKQIELAEARGEKHLGRVYSLGLNN